MLVVAQLEKRLVHGGLGLGRILQLDHHERHAVHEQHHVGTLHHLAVLHRPLVHRVERVLLGMRVVDELHKTRRVVARHTARAVHPVLQPVRELLVAHDDASARDAAHLADRVVHRLVGHALVQLAHLILEHIGERRVAVVALDVGTVHVLPLHRAQHFKHRVLVGVLVVRSRRHHATCTFSTSISPLINFGSSASRSEASVRDSNNNTRI